MKTTKAELQKAVAYYDMELTEAKLREDESRKLECDLRSENTKLRFAIRSLVKEYGKVIVKLKLMEAGLKPGAEEE